MKNRKFGPYIKLLRKDRKMSVEEIAKEIELSKTDLAQIEETILDPPDEIVIHRIATVFDEDIDRLLGLADKISSDLIPIILRHPILIADLIRSLRYMSSAKLELISDYADAL